MTLPDPFKDSGRFSPRLSVRREIERKVFHLVGLILPAGYILLGQSVARNLMLVGLAVVVCADVLRLRWSYARYVYDRYFAFLSRDTERTGPTGATLFMLAQTVTALVFPTAIVPVAMSFGIIGDPAAAIAGKYWGGPQWRPGKTLIGTGACLVASFGAGILWGTLDWWIVVIGAVVAALVEGISGRINDNLTIPTIGGLVMWGITLL
jgi:dolichol kinase